MELASAFSYRPVQRAPDDYSEFDDDSDYRGLKC